MAINIIKEGRRLTKFTITCPDCGCEFEYEQEDVKVNSNVCLTSYPSQYEAYVICPCCGKHLYHGYVTKSISNYPSINYSTTRMEIKDINCDTCPDKPNPEKPVVGDSPCDWCIKRHFTCKQV